MTTLDQAYEMGAKGAEPTETERLLFEAWMKGHCWMVHGDWDGKTYVHATERNGEVNYHTMHTRQLWAAWRDRAALAEQPAQQEPVAWCTKSDLENMAKGFIQDVPARSMRVPQLYPKESIVLLYTPPAQRTWVGLTDEEIEKELGPFPRWISEWDHWDLMNFASAIEVKLKEKNT